MCMTALLSFMSPSGESLNPRVVLATLDPTGNTTKCHLLPSFGIGMALTIGLGLVLLHINPSGKFSFPCDL